MEGAEALSLVVGILGELVLDKGQVSASMDAGSVRLVDVSKSWKANIFRGCVVYIVHGPGVGQKALILGNGADYLEIMPPWKFGIHSTSMYVIYQDLTAMNVDNILHVLSGHRTELGNQPPILDEVQNIEDKLDTWLKFWLGLIFQDALYLEDHFHGKEDWLGISADQSGDNWGTVDRLVPYQVTTGGADAFGNELKVLGSDDTPVRAGKVKFDMHRIVVTDQSAVSLYYARFVWGTGVFADALAAGQYTTVPVIADSAIGFFAGGSPVDVRMTPLPVGTKIWVQAKNAAGSQTLDFVVGLHEYDALPQQQ